MNEEDFNNDKKGEKNIFIKNEMNQDLFDLEESNKVLNEKLENLENYYKNKNNELEFELEKKEILINKLYYDKELLNATIETMKKEIKKIEEEKEDLSKEKSELFISFSDIINYNEELKIEVQNLKDKYESIKKENEEKKPKTIKKNQSIQTLSIIEDNIKTNLQKLGINNTIITKNDVNSIIIFLLKYCNTNVINKNNLFKLEQENKILKNNYEKNVNELKKLNIIINSCKNDKVKLENLVSEKENKINDLKNEIKEKDDNLNLKFVETKKDEIKLENLKSELDKISNEYNNFKNNMSNKLLELNQEYINTLQIQKEMILLNKLFESHLTNSKNDNNLNKVKEQILKIKTLANKNDIDNSNNNNKINNETIDSITLKIKDILKFIFESYLNISKQLYSQFKNINERINNTTNNGKRKFILELKGLLEKYSKIIEINDIKKQFNNQINKFNEMNLDDCISFIFSILDNLIIKILNQENNNFNKCDKINNYYYKQNNFNDFDIKKKIQKKGKELLELEAELKKLNDLQMNNKK